jgi:uncharacterized membrane protein YdbT with pleckstrin-like domain
MKENKLKILNYSLKSLWLLLFPVARALFQKNADITFFRSWLEGACLDLLILFFVILIGYMKWSLAKFYFDNKKVVFDNNLPIQKKKIIPYANISSVSAKQSILIKPFNAIKVSIDTRGGNVKHSDLDLLMNVKDWEEIKHKITIFSKSKTEKFKFKYKAGFWGMILFSLLFSSSISGVVYIATILVQLGKTAGDLLMSQRDTFQNISEQMAASIALKIPPIGFAIAIILIATKLLSFTLNLFRYANFEIANDKNLININSGLLAKREFFLTPSKINYTDLEQNMLMKIFSLTSIHVNCAGYGNNGNEIPVFLPIMGSKQAENVLNRLFIFGRVKKPTVRPKFTAVFRFITLPVVIIGVLCVIYFILSNLFPYYKKTFFFFMIIFLVPSFWFLIVKFLSVFYTGFSYENGIYNINICKNFKFHNISVREENIIKIQISQNIFQKYFKKCDISFNLNSEKGKKIKIKSIDTFFLVFY